MRLPTYRNGDFGTKSIVGRDYFIRRPTYNRISRRAVYPANLPRTNLFDIGDPTFFRQAEKRVGVVFIGNPIASQCSNDPDIRFDVQKEFCGKIMSSSVRCCPRAFVWKCPGTSSHTNTAARSTVV